VLNITICNKIIFTTV